MYVYVLNLCGWQIFGPTSVRHVKHFAFVTVCNLSRKLCSLALLIHRPKISSIHMFHIYLFMEITNVFILSLLPSAYMFHLDLFM